MSVVVNNTTTMTPEAQRIAIAEACGWTKHDGDWMPPSASSLKVIVGTSDADTNTYPPDYLSDLNAMHEAEKVLLLRQQTEYMVHLTDITDSTAFLRNHATAAQRAEAFLRTIGKWDGK